MILAIDQGTTGSTCLVFDLQGELLARAYSEFEQHFPQPGWVEHDASEIWDTTQRVAGKALTTAGVEPGELAAVGITNQRETVVAWDRRTGQPLARAIVWQDRRTTERCEQLREQGHAELIRERTGLPLDPYFSGSKIEWLLANSDAVRSAAAAGHAAFGTVDSWLIFKLTGAHLTDASNASRTMLYNLKTGDWDPELLALFGVPAESLPEIVPSCGELAETRAESLFGHTVPVAGVAGDQQAALFGQGCLAPGQGKNTYGTGSFVLQNAGSSAPKPSPELVATVAWQVGERISYAFEAPIFVTGAAVQWLRDGLGLIASASETEALAASVEDTGGVYFVPALTGLGSPYWDPWARGTIVGLTRGSGKAELVRATLEAIAFQTVDAVRAIEARTGEAFPELRADGGATANAWLMQFQADMLGVPVRVPEVAETTALGAALLAGVGVNQISLDQVAAGRSFKAEYEPSFGADRRAELLDGWHRAVERSRGWADA